MLLFLLIVCRVRLSALGLLATSISIRRAMPFFPMALHRSPLMSCYSDLNKERILSFHSSRTSRLHSQHDTIHAAEQDEPYLLLPTPYCASPYVIAVPYVVLHGVHPMYLTELNHQSHTRCMHTTISHLKTIWIRCWRSSKPVVPFRVT